MAQKRLVGFFDILGFKNKLNSTPLDELAAHYENLASSARAMSRPVLAAGSEPSLFPERPAQQPWCVQHIFSDSIILVANEDTDRSCLELLVYAWRLSQAFLGAGMSLRGGLEYGEMYSNTATGVFLGQALTRAYQLEGRQDWSGSAIGESVWDRYLELKKLVDDDSRIFSTVFMRYAVPMKNGERVSLRTLNWRFNYIVEKGTRSLFSKSDAPDVKSKIENTLEYARAVIEAGKVYIQDQTKFPVELRSMFVGGREPPFPHGDDL